MAATYTANVTYQGSGTLYYAVHRDALNPTDVWASDNSGRTCFAVSGGVKVTDSPEYDLESQAVNFYRDRNCQTNLTSVKASALFADANANNRVSIVMAADGRWEYASAVSSSSRWPQYSSAATPRSSSNAVVRSSSSRGEIVGPTPRSSSSSKVVNGKVIRFMPHWTNTSAILVQGLEEKIMTAVPKYCGWFETTVESKKSDFYISFKQTVGTIHVGGLGSSNKAIPSEEEILLDSIAALSDTIWIRSYKSGEPEMTVTAPGVLGDCAPKRFPVTVYDWHAAGKTGVNADFEASNGCTGKNARDKNNNGYTKGMVEYRLGANGVPQRAKDFPEEDCRASEHLDYWFLPESLAVDKNGKKLTNKTCRDLYLTLEDDGFWLAEINKNKVSKGNEGNNGGMFIVDDFEYLDPDSTVLNPYFDQAKGSGGTHNFSFAVKIQAKFEYVRGQYFDFYGDDDVWVFIDRRLAVDIGGQHTQVSGEVLLDTIGQNTGDTLVPGKTYDFHIFYAERHTSESNFRMHTSIDLQVDASMFVIDDKKGKTTDYYVWQVNRNSTFNCDMDENAKDTTITGGRSIFRLTGGNLTEPEILDVGTHYEGIKITSDSTFTIDSAAIVDNYALAPGHYFLEIILKDDQSQKTTVEIVVPSYAIPSIAFADTSDWKLLGTEVSGDSLQIGKWAHSKYRVNITFFEEWAEVNNYNKKVGLTVSDSSVDILDSLGNKISKVMLDSNGRASFYLRANKAVEGVVLTAQGVAASASHWIKLKFEEPPIPHVVMAKIFDRNGDGRGDSLYVKLSKKLDSKNILDSLSFKFGETFPVYGKNSYKADGDEVTLVSEGDCDASSACGFGSRRFTGGESSVYFGTLYTWFSYVDSGNKKEAFDGNVGGEIEDGIGPVIVSAERKKNSDGNRELVLTFSEALSDSSRAYFKDMFEFKCMRGGEDKKPEKPILQAGSTNTMVLVYSGSTTIDAVIPMDGDRIRFVPGNKMPSTRDLVGIAPHKDNPWVIITGEQELSNESPNVVTVGSDNPIVANSTPTQPVLITNTDQTAQEIGDSLGVQGNLIDFDIYKVIQDQTKKEIAALDAYIDKMLGDVATDDTVWTYTQMSEEDALKQLFEDIENGLVTDAFGLSEELISAVKNGEVTAANYKKSGVVSKEDLSLIDKLVKEQVELSRDSTMQIKPAENATLADLFEKIRSGKISEEELKEAGISEDVIEAIKDGTITPENLPEFRSGEKTLMDEDSVTLAYSTKYYSHLGHYVGGTSGTIACSDTAVYGTGGCQSNKGKIFLAWNMRGSDGRVVGTGVYIARLQIKVIVSGKKKLDQTRDKLWGVRRGKVNLLDL